MNISTNAKWLIGTGLTVVAMSGTAFAAWDSLTDRVAVAESKAEQYEKNSEDIKKDLEWIKRCMIEKCNQQENQE